MTAAHRWTTKGTHTHAADHHVVEFIEDAPGESPRVHGYIRFQDGPIAERGPNGTTNEEVMRVVIERIEALNTPPFSCRENSIALTHLQTALLWLEERTRQRQNRGVEGTATP